MFKKEKNIKMMAKLKKRIAETTSEEISEFIKAKHKRENKINMEDDLIGLTPEVINKALGLSDVNSKVFSDTERLASNIYAGFVSSQSKFSPTHEKRGINIERARACSRYCLEAARVFTETIGGE